MVTTRTGIFKAIRLVLIVSVLVGVASAAQASPLTLHFSGTVDLSGSGGAADNPFSGFFTWDTAEAPFLTDPGVALYHIEAHQLIFNGADLTGAPDNGGLFVFNDVNAFGTGAVDALMFGTMIDSDPVAGDTLLLLAFSGPTDSWDTVALPTDYSFLSKLTTRFAAVSLEVPGEDDENDISLGRGSFEVAVPEPAMLTLGLFGLAGVVARTRRQRQR